MFQKYYYISILNALPDINVGQSFSTSFSHNVCVIVSKISFVHGVHEWLVHDCISAVAGQCISTLTSDEWKRSSC